MFTYTTNNILFISAKNQSTYINQYNLKEGRSLVFLITWPHLFFLFKGSEFWISTLPNKICSFDEPILPWKIDFYDNLSNMDRSLIRVSVQGLKSLGSHFACFCREFDFCEVKKKLLLFLKKKREILLHF